MSCEDWLKTDTYKLDWLQPQSNDAFAYNQLITRVTVCCHRTSLNLFPTYKQYDKEIHE